MFFLQATNIVICRIVRPFLFISGKMSDTDVPYCLKTSKKPGPAQCTDRVPAKADNQIRTGDLILTKDALYLLSYISKRIDYIT